MASESVVPTNTRGRPRASTKPSQAKPPVPPTQELHRRSFSTYAPYYFWSNMFDLNQQLEPEKHNIEFQPYVSNIQNVERDGHCGLQAIVVSLGYSDDYWHQIRTNL
uniref:OTU domain-containing protein n=1 Tax=Lactuca sativa TaxID=4236 RepID=A0A9R1W185_LACSA|nr:hypothetical protein LSAT_V11C300138140 [Lactuca sativa]